MACDTYRLYRNTGSTAVDFSFPFVEMGPVPPPNTHNWLTYKAHAGVAGYAVYQDGKRGELFDVVTVADCVSISDGVGVNNGAKDTYQKYQAQCGTQAAIIEWRSSAWGTVLIHDVKCLEMRPILLWSGQKVNAQGPLFNPKAVLVCRWTLLKVSD